MTALALTITGLIVFCHQFIKKKKEFKTVYSKNWFDFDETMTAARTPFKIKGFRVIILASFHRLPIYFFNSI